MSDDDAVMCAGLEYAFGETRAVDGLDLSVTTGEVFGLLGPNGAGKTTAIRCVTTLRPVPAGRIRVFGHDATGMTALWLLICGETFTRIKAIPTGGIPYIDYLAPGIIAQSAMFIAIFYGIMIIWERDSGILTKLLVTPTPRSALITGKAFAAGVKALIEAVVVIAIAALLGVALTWNPLKLIGVGVAVVLGSAFFSCLSMSIAGIVLTRDRLMGIGQAITMPLFFGSSALYPADRGGERA